MWTIRYIRPSTMPAASQGLNYFTRGFNLAKNCSSPVDQTELNDFLKELAPLATCRYDQCLRNPDDTCPLYIKQISTRGNLSIGIRVEHRNVSDVYVNIVQPDLNRPVQEVEAFKRIGEDFMPVAKIWIGAV